MAVEGDTGLGSTAAFTTLSTFSPAITEIELPNLFELDAIDATHLGTTGYMENQLADLSEPGIVKLTCIFDTADAMPTSGAADTITVTFPLRSGESGASTYSGTGQFKRVSMPTLVKDDLQTFEVEFQMNGDTGPTYAKST